MIYECKEKIKKRITKLISMNIHIRFDVAHNEII